MNMPFGITWRDLPPTRKQMDFIETACDFSEFPLPRFDGTTRGEASDWIKDHGKLASTRAVTRDYGDMPYD